MHFCASTPKSRKLKWHTLETLRITPSKSGKSLKAQRQQQQQKRQKTAHRGQCEYCILNGDAGRATNSVARDKRKEANEAPCQAECQLSQLAEQCLKKFMFGEQKIKLKIHNSCSMQQQQPQQQQEIY